MYATTRRTALLLGSACLVATGCGGSAVTGGQGSDVAASCAAIVEYDGHTYLGRAPLQREPATTGRQLDGSIPSCNDTGDDDAEPAELVQLSELSDVPASTAVLFNGGIYVREGADLPPTADSWFTAPDCTSDGEFALVGDWLGVEGPKPVRFDGDIRPPYRVELRVEDGPEDYVGATIQVHADQDTDPLLGPDDVKQSLWQEGQVIAQVRCASGRFEATSLRSAPPG